MKTIKTYERFAVNESEKVSDDLQRIKDSGLFIEDNGRYRYPIEKMIAILDWYESLPADKAEFVDILRDDRGEGKYEYTEEDLRKAIEMAQEESWDEGGYLGLEHKPNEIIQSLRDLK